MGRTSKNVTDYIDIRFAGIGSIAYIKRKHEPKGLFWTIENTQYILVDTRSSTIKESPFASYEELTQYCTQQFKRVRLLT